MGNSFTITQIKSADGTVKAFRSYEASENSSDIDKKKNADGSESVFTKLKIKDKNGNEKYMYVEAEEISRTVVPEAATKDPSKLPTFRSMGETKYDKVVDAVTDGVLGIDNSKPSTDGKDDGKINGWDMFKHFCKGVLAPVKAVIKNPVKSLGVTLGIGLGLKVLATVGLGAVATAVGPIMLGVGLIAGLTTLAVGATKAITSKTDGDAKAAWENIGTGTITTVLSAIGLRKMYKAAQAKTEAFPNETKYQTPTEKLKTDLVAKTQAHNDAVAARDALKVQHEIAGKLSKAQHDLWQAKHTRQDADKIKALGKTVESLKQELRAAGFKGKIDLAPESGQVFATKVSGQLEAANAVAQRAANAKQVAENAVNALPTKREFSGLAGKVRSIKGKLTLDPMRKIAYASKDNQMEGAVAATKRLGKKVWGYDITKADMGTVKTLEANAKQAILSGSHYKAKAAIDEMQAIVANNKVTGDDAAAATQIIKNLSKLASDTRILHKAPGLKTVAVGAGNIENATDDSATAWTRLGDNAYTVASAS